MKTKRHFLCCLIAVSVTVIATVHPLVAQDFTIRMKMDDGAEGTTYYVSPNAIRRTTPGANDVIERMDRGTMIYLDHRSKTYKEGPVAQAKEAMANGIAEMNDPQQKAMLHKMGLDAPPQLTKIGPAKTLPATRRKSIRSRQAWHRENCGSLRLSSFRPPTTGTSICSPECQVHSETGAKSPKSMG